ncbi:hypothetical protein H2200_004645 [Cladophialophora chaetospira]|uniref:Tachykinin family protein n=1 Tax=Cladophialophora chaetospira TaxID=386627 RepID=A0AA39CKP8_9EURO|nr:hypothetical protein H2200_004645 [Cladophialophora chaetospira]
MARAMRIEQLLLNNHPSVSGIDRPLARIPTSKKNASLRRPPERLPAIVVKTSPASPLSASSPEEEPFSGEPENEKIVSFKPRKRKSPVDEDAFPIANKSTRLPRFSVNIFHSEPASTFPIPNEGVVPRMVKYFLQVWAPQHGRALAFEGHPIPYQSLVFPYALQHGVLFESIVAVARAAWLQQEQIPWQTDTAFTFHRANAFAGLRSRLRSESMCSDDTTILTIAALTTIDYMLGVHEGAANHVNAMQQIQKIRHDLTGETPWQYIVVSVMKAYDGLWQFIKDRNELTTSMAQLTIDSPMHSDLPIYPSLPFNIRVCEALSKVSTAFNDLALARELSMQMIEILANLSTQARGDGSATPPTSPPTSPGGRSLLNTIADLRCISVMQTTPIEHKLCFGVIGTCFTLHYGTGMIGDDMNETLQMLEDTLIGNGRLRVQPEAALKAHRECLIWISVATAGALEQSELLSAMSMVLDQALEKYPDEMTDWDTLEKILRKFLWNDLLGKHWKKCWRKAMHRRSTVR